MRIKKKVNEGQMAGARFLTVRERHYKYTRKGETNQAPETVIPLLACYVNRGYGEERIVGVYRNMNQHTHTFLL